MTLDCPDPNCHVSYAGSTDDPDALLYDLIHHFTTAHIAGGAAATPSVSQHSMTSTKPLAIDAAHLERQREWSTRTFGPGRRTKGVVDHITKEFAEIEQDPDDVREWIDVVILALDGALRTGAHPSAIIAGIVAKQARNEARTWPDWRSAPSSEETNDCSICHLLRGTMRRGWMRRIDRNRRRRRVRLARQEQRR
jgi:hypothetical protein